MQFIFKSFIINVVGFVFICSQDFPGLLKLHSKDEDSTDVSMLRFKLFSLSVLGACEAVDSTLLESLDPRDLGLFAALAVIVGYRGHRLESCHFASGEASDAGSCECRLDSAGALAPVMELWEARAFIVAHFIVTRNEKGGEESAKRVRLSGRHDPRAANLASSFVSIPIADLDWVLGAIYQDEADRMAVTLRNAFFDGVLFQVRFNLH